MGVTTPNCPSCYASDNNVYWAQYSDAARTLQSWRKHTRRRYLSIVDTGRCETTSEGSHFFVPTSCFSHMAWTPYSHFLQPLVAWFTKAPDNVYVLQIFTTNVHACLLHGPNIIIF